MHTGLFGFSFWPPLFMFQPISSSLKYFNVANFSFHLFVYTGLFFSCRYKLPVLFNVKWQTFLWKILQNIYTHQMYILWRGRRNMQAPLLLKHKTLAIVLLWPWAYTQRFLLKKTICKNAFRITVIDRQATKTRRLQTYVNKEEDVTAK